MASHAWTILLIVQEAAVVLVIISILRRPKEPRAMLAWILLLLLLPVVGLVVYALSSEPRKQLHRRRRARRRRRLANVRARQSARRHTAAGAEPRNRAQAGLQKLMALAERLGAPPPTDDNDVVVYHDAEQTFLAIQLAIEAATSHVHLEYYIVQPDETGTAIRDLLIAKARSGVRCRLLLDYVGCWRLSRDFLRPMHQVGVQVAFTLPVIPWRGRWRVNYRNHRKIAVIDGRVGFTGSQNIGDEYRGRRARYGPWRDTHLKIVGPAVQHLQEVFVEDWHYTVKEDLAGDDYFPLPESAGRHVVQVLPSGPDQHVNVMHHLLFAAVSAARSSISVITPYFVPDSAMVLALQSAAYRGVRVRLVVPSCSNHRVVLWAGRSFYPELCRAGVEIYEHDQTMLHSKVMIIDETWAMVGSANIDERSFRINFEVTTLLYSTELAQELYRDFESQRIRSSRIDPNQAADRSFGRSLALGLARMASPLL